MVRRPQRRELPHDYTVEVMGRRYAVTDMKRASDIVLHIQASENLGASEMGAEFPIRAGEFLIGYVTYNGRVWKGDPRNWETNECVYEPFRGPGPIPPVSPSRVVRNNPVHRRRCDKHDDISECIASPSSCGFTACDAHEGEDYCKTPSHHYADTKSFFCSEGRAQFLRDYRFDEQLGDWVERRRRRL